MGINSQSDIAANLPVGPTDRSMVRIYIEAEGLDLPLDFDPEEATEIAEELCWLRLRPHGSWVIPTARAEGLKSPTTERFGIDRAVQAQRRRTVEITDYLAPRRGPVRIGEDQPGIIRQRRRNQQNPRYRLRVLK